MSRYKFIFYAFHTFKTSGLVFLIGFTRPGTWNDAHIPFEHFPIKVIKHCVRSVLKTFFRYPCCHEANVHTRLWNLPKLRWFFFGVFLYKSSLNQLMNSLNTNRFVTWLKYCRYDVKHTTIDQPTFFDPINIHFNEAVMFARLDKHVGCQLQKVRSL